MAGIFSYIITMMGGLFWIFRLVVSITYSMDVNFPVTPLNFNTEITLLFITIICMIFIIKRNIIGALVYFVGYGLYFGNDLYNGIVSAANGETSIFNLSLVVSFLGILIPFLTVMDIFLNKDRTTNVKDKKTDWYYKNKDYDRNLDDRSDKNQYKF